MPVFAIIISFLLLPIGVWHDNERAALGKPVVIFVSKQVFVIIIVFTRPILGFHLLLAHAQGDLCSVDRLSLVPRCDHFLPGLLF